MPALATKLQFEGDVILCHGEMAQRLATRTTIKSAQREEGVKFINRLIQLSN